MNRWHFFLSFFKSSIRIAGCLMVFLLPGQVGLLGLASFFLVAEILGYLEELK